MKSITQKIAEEAARIYFDYPDLTIAECVEKAERIYQDAEDERDTENNLLDRRDENGL